jgi:hypothetical protein
MQLQFFLSKLWIDSLKNYERKRICWGLSILSNCETNVYVSLSLLYEKHVKLFDFWFATRRNFPVGSNVK